MSTSEPTIHSRGVIIPAAGRGTRFQSEVPKQYHVLAGVPILIRSVRTALAVRHVRSVVVAVHADDIDVVNDLLRSAEVADERIHLVVGSTERQHSVSRALLHPSLANVATILVHDAVRPLASVDLWERVAEGAERTGAAIPALPVADTLKHVSADGIVLSTPDRSSFVRVQTPQGFAAERLRAAYALAERDGVAATDCAPIVERFGAAVHVVSGDETNFKITTPYDLRVAAFLLANSDR